MNKGKLKIGMKNVKNNVIYNGGNTDYYFLDFLIYTKLGYTYRKVYTTKYPLYLILSLDKKFNGNIKKVEKVISRLFKLNGVEVDTIYPHKNVFEYRVDFSNFYYTDRSNKEDIYKRSFIYHNPNNGFYQLFNSILTYDQMLKLLDKLYIKKIDMHNFKENLPTFTKKNLKSEEIHNEIFNFLIKILDYKEDRVMEVLNYINYSKIRNAKNYQAILEHLDVISLSRNGMNYTIVEKAGSLKLNSSNDVLYSDFFKFSKTKDDVYSIGQRTMCCFRKGGAANSLLAPALSSPIAGILLGEFNRDTWFSFVWEIVTENKKYNGLFDISLILDNVECSTTLSMHQITEIRETLYHSKQYKKLLMGNLRNDISSNFIEGPILGEDEGYYCIKDSLTEDEGYNCIKDSLTERESYLVSYEKNFMKYGYDDSKYVYTLFNRKVNTKFYLHKMDSGDKHRVKYVERIIWGNNNDEDLVANIEKSNSPSYIIDNNESIIAYAITSTRKYDKISNTLFSSIKELKKWKYENGFSKEKVDERIKNVLYFEDIFFPKNKEIIVGLKYIFEDFKKYIVDNEIKEIYLSANLNSKNFLKRFNDIDCEVKQDPNISNPYEPKVNPVEIDLDLELINNL